MMIQPMAEHQEVEMNCSSTYVVGRATLDSGLLTDLFTHHLVRGVSGQVTSQCIACGHFIAASPKLEAIRIAEKAHRCSKR